MSNDWKIGLKLSAYVIIAVWLVRTFLVTSCFIPSSGMENTLYQGEGVLVNKWSYGLRMPFPSFLGYHRIGNCDVGKGDIVIFNDLQNFVMSFDLHFIPFLWITHICQNDSISHTK